MSTSRLGGLTAIFSVRSSIRWLAEMGKTSSISYNTAMTTPSPTPKRPNYGLDAPGTVRNFALLGAGFVVLGAVLYFVLRDSSPALAVSLLNMGAWPGGWFMFTAILMILGSKFGKFRVRDRLLDRIAWRGDEQVLDVGCGHGLMLIGAAKRLKTGKVTGVDLWQQEDQASNSAAATLENARLEGVANRVEIKDGDAQAAFPGCELRRDRFQLGIHNIYDRPGRAQAVREIVRVLKPGGRVALVDIRHSAEYAEVLRASGLQQVTRSRPNFVFVIPSFAVTGSKPPHAG